MLADELIETARSLAAPGEPTQAGLRRAISTAYYALFHAVARDAADLLVGTETARAWAHLYRALDHGFARHACAQVPKLGFPDGLKRCAEVFSDLQTLRHSADYDPRRVFELHVATDAISSAERAIAFLRAAPEPDRRAFAVQLLLRQRPA